MKITFEFKHLKHSTCPVCGAPPEQLEIKTRSGTEEEEVHFECGCWEHSRAGSRPEVTIKCPRDPKLKAAAVEELKKWQEVLANMKRLGVQSGSYPDPTEAVERHIKDLKAQSLGYSGYWSVPVGVKLT